MNKGLILSLGVLLVGGIVWFALSSKGGADATPKTAGAAGPGIAPSGGTAATKLQAPPPDAARDADSQASAAESAKSAAAAANRAPASQPPPPLQLVPGMVAASTDAGSNPEAVFADRYAKVDMSARLAKLDELTKLYDAHVSGTWPADTKALDEDQVTQLQLEIAWLTANPGG